jgi:AcrR family transcriptional regulator
VSKGAVLLDAMIDRAHAEAPSTDTGALGDDLKAFLAATFHTAGRASNSSLLRTVMAEAQRDHHVADFMQRFTAERRQVLRELLERGRDRSELAPDADLDLLVDQAYGLLWYRIMMGHAPLTEGVASRLADHLMRSCPPAL